MCGIFALLNPQGVPTDTIKRHFLKGKHRGPDNSTFQAHYNMLIGFHRLAINGLNGESNQPIHFNNVILICNGEIYNYKELYKLINTTPTTGSDCEVIIHIFIKYGIEQTLTMLDGVFAFVLYDMRCENGETEKVYIARDAHGIRPLYYLKNLDCGYVKDELVGFASELKCLDSFIVFNPHQYKVEQFKPGTYSIFQRSGPFQLSWKKEIENKSFYSHVFSNVNNVSLVDYPSGLLQSISSQLNAAVQKQCGATERPIACLLSGGLDSSLITALVNDFCKKNNQEYRLETYSIGLKGSVDLKYAKIAADYMQTTHTEIIVTEEEMFDAIESVIYSIESYDTTTVRASIGNYLLGKYISKNSDAKVIFNGDGSDELCGGYLYMNNCPDIIEFDKETRRLLTDIHLFDVLRSDKCISSHGLEPRTPFLDRDFVNFYLSIPADIRKQPKCEKFLLRSSFDFTNFQNLEGKQILPNEILWRRKEAFSDGVSNEGRSLFHILQERIVKYYMEKNSHVYPLHINTEKMYYKQIFDWYYPNSSNIVPYFWMPKYTNTDDPSARTLETYKNPPLQNSSVDMSTL